MTARVEIDLNVRVRGAQTFAGLEDVSGPIAVGHEVEVVESESDVWGRAVVTEIDVSRRLVYLAVDWANLRPSDGRGVSGDVWDLVKRSNEGAATTT